MANAVPFGNHNQSLRALTRGWWLAAEEVGDGGDNAVLFFGEQLGEDGEGEDFAGGAFAFWQGEDGKEVADGGLLVERCGVVDFAGDAVEGKVFAQGVALGDAQDVLVEDVAGTRVDPGEDDAVAGGGAADGSREACGREQLIVAVGKCCAAAIPGREMAEFYGEDGGLHAVEPRVPADLVVGVAAAHAVGAEHAGALCELGGGGGEETGVTGGAEIFGGIEAEGGGVAERAGGPAGPGGAEGLGGVFEEQQIVLLAEGVEGVHVGALAVEVDRQERAQADARMGVREVRDGLLDGWSARG